MKLNVAKYNKKNRKNVIKNTRRMIENANFLTNGKITASRQELEELIEWRKGIRANISVWREEQKAAEMSYKI